MKIMTSMRQVAALIIVALIVALMPVTAKASTTYSQTVTYVNPLGSGSLTYKYTDGAIWISNQKITEYKIVQEGDAAVKSEADLEVTQGFQKTGVFWSVDRNQSLYWWCYEICKKAGWQKWKGEYGKEVANGIKATRLSYKSNSGSMSYVGFTYANYYTSGRDLEDYPLPDWYTLYKVYNDGDEYEEPDPTNAPTQAPTATPTVTPTPTSVPTPTCPCGNGGECTCPDGQCTCENCSCGPTASCHPTATVTPTQEPPTSTPDSKSGGCQCMNGGTCSCTDGNCQCGDDCTCSHCKGKVTPTPVVVVEEAPVQDAEPTINGNGNVTNITQNITNTNTQNNISITGDGNSVTAGASVGNAAASGSSGTTASEPVATIPSTTAKKTTTKKSSSKKKTKTYWYATRHGNRVKLWKATKNIKTGKVSRKLKSICLFDEKGQRMDLNAFKRQNVKKCQYTNKKHWIAIIDSKSKDIYFYPIGKGNKKPKRMKGKFVSLKCNSRGLTYAAVTRSGKLKELPR